ncbi:S8 family serine peptidase [Streptomyces sp. NPDC005438]|uniref:S8 family peptidase n=1 Tax=Streptomyces sp. NPDC005438 TaxID=3156880 RepID=UPI0033A1C194
MEHRRSRRRLAIAVPVGLALTASIGLLPVATSALASDSAKAADGETLSYVVNTEAKSGAVKRIAKEVKKNDGKVVAKYPKIGVVVAHSANKDFGAKIRKVEGVDSAGATRTAPLTSAATTDTGKPEYLGKAKVAEANRSATAKNGKEPLESLQWDIPAIKADKAAKVNPGSKKVNVAVIDTGVDDTHPDLKPNFSRKTSASCVGGKADTTKGAWRPFDPDEDYHGTHVAGTIAAARNNSGVAGVAPNVSVSSIKVSEETSSLFFAEAVVCAFVFAGEHGADVTNNSYYVDPWQFNCPDQADQAAILEAVGRAAKFAEKKGAVNVTSAGNSNFDLAAKELLDDTSPNDSEPTERKIDPLVCKDVPTQLPGSLSVSATGSQNLKSYYSNYGSTQVHVAAPGGDKYQVPDGDAKSGGILSTMPNGDYAYLQGTSMAGPHVAGVAALLKSANPKLSGHDLKWKLLSQADDLACPSDPYDPDGDGEVDAECTGSKKYNNFYGHGLTNALKAVQK